jgi:hypothetical protein
VGKKHWHSAHIAGWRQIARLRRIVDMRLRHGEAPIRRHRREHYFCLSATDARRRAVVDDVGIRRSPTARVNPRTSKVAFNPRKPERPSVLQIE